MELTYHSLDSAPEASKPLLQASLTRMTFIPNLHAVMAESPQLLQAYQTLSGLYAKTSLSVLERQIVLLAINYENDCHYCMAAHSAIATLEKMPPEILEALRKGKPLADPKLQALRAFAVKVTVSRGWPEKSDTQTLLAAGYGKQVMLEVILAVGFKVLSNYVNHLAETVPDESFKPFAWSKDAAA
ncbi:MAG: carboxymuconolactone decarboxylase family protein [Rhodospirillales bacterium]